jgi:hypothetical protein
LAKTNTRLRPSNGKHHTQVVGVAPYGFTNVDGRLVENPIEQKVVRRICEMWALGLSFNAIAKKLNQLEIKTRSGKTWEHSIVSNIINRKKSIK